jgi:hypothetical protein
LKVVQRTVKQTILLAGRNNVWCRPIRSAKAPNDRRHFYDFWSRANHAGARDLLAGNRRIPSIDCVHVTFRNMSTQTYWRHHGSVGDVGQITSADQSSSGHIAATSGEYRERRFFVYSLNHGESHS